MWHHWITDTICDDLQSYLVRCRCESDALRLFFARIGFTYIFLFARIYSWGWRFAYLTVRCKTPYVLNEAWAIQKCGIHFGDNWHYPEEHLSWRPGNANTLRLPSRLETTNFFEFSEFKHSNMCKTLKNLWNISTELMCQEIPFTVNGCMFFSFQFSIVACIKS